MKRKPDTTATETDYKINPVELTNRLAGFYSIDNNYGMKVLADYIVTMDA